MLTETHFVPYDSLGNVILPSSIQVTSEYPSLTTDNRSITISKSVNYQRFKFEVEYPPIHITDADELLSAFNFYQGRSSPFYFRIPHIAAKSFANYVKSNSATTLTSLAVNSGIDTVTGESTGTIGDRRIIVNVPNDIDTYPANLLIRFDNHDKIYKTTYYSDQSNGLVTLRIAPNLQQDVTGANVFLCDDIAVAGGDYEGHYTQFKVRFEDDQFEYGTNGAGLVVVKYSLVEDL